MNIKHIELHNFKAIKDFSSEFTGGVYLITGENEIGKSTLLGAISSLLTGNRSDNLLTKGEKKGHAKMKVGEGDDSFEVELKFSDKNPRGSLSITASNGMKSDKKSIIESIFKYQDFDAHDFVQWSQTAEGRRKQVELVKSLIPKQDQVSISNFEFNIREARETRREVSVQVKHFESLYNQKRLTQETVDKYKVKVDPIGLMNEKMKSADHNRNFGEINNRQIEREEIIDGYNIETKRVVSATLETIETQKEVLKVMQRDHDKYVSDRISERSDIVEKSKNALQWIKENPPIPLDGIDQKINEAEDHNQKCEEVKHFLEAEENLKSKTQEEQELTVKIQQDEKKKADIINGSNMPIDGLSFNEEGLFLDDVPFAPGEVSTSQEMEVAAKLIIAKNPTVKVFKIAQGESLGADKLKAIVDFAKSNGYQGFIEEVKRGQNELIVEEYTEK